MELSPSAYPDTFARDRLPPADQWPVLEFTTGLLQYRDRLNAATELIDVPAAAWPGRPAVRTPDGVTVTYAELLARANQVAQVLTEDLGLVPGNRVLLRSPNNPWAVACWLGILKAGGIPATTFAALRARELTPIVEKARPGIALVDHRFTDDVETLRETAAPNLVTVPFGGESEDDLVARGTAKAGVFTNVKTAADDVALFCPTSGSTGAPKITSHFHRDVLSIDNTFGKQTLKLTPEDVIACTAPLAFTFGLGMLVVFPLRAGACGLLTEAATAPQLADIVAELGVTVLATAPTAYKQLIAAGKLDRLGKLRAAVAAGEHIPQQTWWNVTGDTFTRDEDGYFYYQARTGNIVVSSGYNIGGPEVEAAIDEHPAVAESAVVAKPNADRGSIVCAFVVLEDGVVGDDTLVKEIQEHVKATLAPYKYPREIRFVERLPRNTSGKLQHFALRRQLEEELRAAAEGVAS